MEFVHGFEVVRLLCHSDNLGDFFGGSLGLGLDSIPHSLKVEQLSKSFKKHIVLTHFHIL